VNTIKEINALLKNGNKLNNPVNVYIIIIIGAIISNNITTLITNLERVRGIFILLEKSVVVLENVYIFSTPLKKNINVIRIAG
jgi:hypothetical protein